MVPDPWVMLQCAWGLEKHTLLQLASHMSQKTFSSMAHLSHITPSKGDRYGRINHMWPHFMWKIKLTNADLWQTCRGLYQTRSEPTSQDTFTMVITGQSCNWTPCCQWYGQLAYNRKDQQFYNTHNHFNISIQKPFLFLSPVYSPWGSQME